MIPWIASTILTSGSSTSRTSSGLPSGWSAEVVLDPATPEEELAVRAYLSSRFSPVDVLDYDPTDYPYYGSLRAEHRQVPLGHRGSQAGSRRPADGGPGGDRHWPGRVIGWSGRARPVTVRGRSTRSEQGERHPRSRRGGGGSHRTMEAHRSRQLRPATHLEDLCANGNDGRRDVC